jgi:hypothetical protein
MLDPTWDVVSTRTSAALLGSNNKELFGGEALWKAEGGIRVEDGEDHLCEEYNGGFGRQVASILIIAGVEGTICPYGSIWTGPTPIMEITLCESMDPHGPTTRFGNFAIMGPFVCSTRTARFSSRSHDLIVR